MKPLLFFITLFILFNIDPATAQPVQVKYNLPVAPPETKEEAMVYFFEDSVAGKLTVHVYNPHRDKLRLILFKDGMKYCYRTSLVNFTRCFNFSRAEVGDYSLTIFNGSKWVRKGINVVSDANR